MSEAEAHEVTSFDSLGRLLIEERRRIDGMECRWMQRLAEFDEREGWRHDGHLCASSWLVQRCGMSRPAAKERLRVAREIRRRPLLLQAFADGDLSYSKMRPLTRITDVTEEDDRVLVQTARDLTAADLDVVVQHWREMKGQDTPLKKQAWEKRGLRHYRRFDGLHTIEIVLQPDDAERLVTVLDAYLRWQRQATEPSASAVQPRPVDPAGSTEEQDEPVDPAGSLAPLVGPLPPTWAERRADALVDLVEEAVAHLDETTSFNGDRVSMSVIVDYGVLAREVGRSEISGGAALRGEAARRLACEAKIHRIIVKGASEVLDVGRETSQWNRAQRRAIQFRHGGLCAVAGCPRRIVDIHHTHWWSKGGTTDLDLGVPLCYGHHRLVHEGGWSIEFDPVTSTTTLTGPQGQRLVTAVGTVRKDWPLAA